VCPAHYDNAIAGVVVLDTICREPGFGEPAICYDFTNLPVSIENKVIRDMPEGTKPPTRGCGGPEARKGYKRIKNHVIAN
jgi:hypothetical protein